MRTPAAMIVGMVLAPCGLVLTLTSTFAPDWRLISNLFGESLDVYEHQGIWDICSEREATHARQCGIERPEYFALQQVQVARGLMLTSMAVTVGGIVLASIGVRCWQEYPIYLVAGLGGLLLFVSGVLSLIPISWYNSEISRLPGATGTTIEVGYSLILGYIGSCFEIIGGASLALSLVHSCQERLQSRAKAGPATSYFSKKAGVGLGPPALSYYRDPDGRSTAYSITDYSIRRDPMGDPRRPDSFHWDDPRHRDFVSTVPRSYTNPTDVTAGEMPSKAPPPRPRSHVSSLPCDSDLL